MTDIKITVGPDGTAAFVLDGKDISRVVRVQTIEINPESRTVTLTLATSRRVTVNCRTLALRMEPERPWALVAAGWTPPQGHDGPAVREGRGR